MKTEYYNEPFDVEYSIYVPAGNDTAFVYGLNYTQEQKKIINDEIMANHPNVEQVGFIDTKEKPELQMAGGEFCGNATRSAASIYLNGKPGNIQITVNLKDLINAGVTETGKAWCEIPLYKGSDVITQKEPGIYIVKLNGMVTIVIQEEASTQYLKNKSKLKTIATDFIKKYNLEYSEAVGIMFCEKKKGMLKINPVVWVKSINTLFYETACGSGTTAVAMIQTILKNKSQTIDILQPSGMIITANTTYTKGTIEKVTISGDIKTNGARYSMKIIPKNN